MEPRTADTTGNDGRDRKRLLIVDDHPIVRQGLAQLIRKQPDLEVVGEAEDARQAMDVVHGGDVDIAIVDLALPGLSGIELIKQIKAVDAGIEVLVLSMHEQLFYAERALRAGATGYIMKHEPIEKVVEAVRKVFSGEVYVSKAVATRLLHRFVGGGSGLQAPIVDRLSDRELEVFQLIGQGYGTRQVAELLHLSVKTIESYRANIKEKLQLKNASELMQHAVQWVQTDQSD